MVSLLTDNQDPAVANVAKSAAESAEPSENERRSRPRPWLDQLSAIGISRSLRYPETTLGKLFDQTADRYGPVPALIYAEEEWTYAELAERINRMAGALAALGVRRGDRVLITLPNCPEYVMAFFATQKLGAVVVNAGPLMGPDDLQSLIVLTSPRVGIGLDLQAQVQCAAAEHTSIETWIWCSLQAYQPVFKRLGYRFKLWQSGDQTASCPNTVTLDKLLEQAPSRPPTVAPDVDDTAVLSPTGGTSGSLKVAQLTHRNLICNATQVTVGIRIRYGQERIMGILPMFHAYGLSTCLVSSVITGATLIPFTRFNVNEVLDAVDKHRPTIFPLVPAICEAISNELEKPDAGHDFGCVNLAVSGAAPLPDVVAERFERLTGVSIVQGYGQTEASPVVMNNPPGHTRLNSIGLPLPDTDVRVVDPESGEDVACGEPGELIVSGPQVMKGYFNNPDETQRVLRKHPDGRVWLHTGDVARVDDEGYFYIVDRMKDMIIRSGLKVYPAKVEKRLKGLDGVNEVAVIGVPDPVQTELVVAMIVPTEKNADEDALRDSIRDFCREHMAPYEVPARIEFVDEFPRTGLGKLLKYKLREIAEERHAQRLAQKEEQDQCDHDDVHHDDQHDASRHGREEATSERETADLPDRRDVRERQVV